MSTLSEAKELCRRIIKFCLALFQRDPMLVANLQKIGEIVIELALSVIVIELALSIIVIELALSVRPPYPVVHITPMTSTTKFCCSCAIRTLHLRTVILLPTKGQSMSWAELDLW